MIFTICNYLLETITAIVLVHVK